jgi:Na+-transporting NADH:ubiquinone oxidoreductase subunit A
MTTHRIKRGLDLPIDGQPLQDVVSGPRLASVAITAADFIGMKPRMSVAVGDTVKRGETLFEDRSAPGVLYTAPAAGTIKAIHRGERRVLRSVVIDLSESERNQTPGADECQRFEAFSGRPVEEMNGDDVESLLLESGLWTALRQRPFSKVPAPGSRPGAIFVNAMDTHPLAPDMDVVLTEAQDDLDRGLSALKLLSEGKTYLCRKSSSFIKTQVNDIHLADFSGPHPAGTSGVHIHTLYPVNRQRCAWHIGAQDVVAIGKLFATGELCVTRVVALAGSRVRAPKLVRTRLGANINQLLEGRLHDGPCRIISGSVLSGRAAQEEEMAYLGRYHQQVSVIPEDKDRHFVGWLKPGMKTFSVLPIFLSKLFGPKSYSFTTTTHGSPRAIVPFESYDKVMPFDIITASMLRALSAQDTEWAEQLGVLELDEEDLSLCTFVCPGKGNYAPLLRQTLNQIEGEG